jgi:predicted enzyme related to lactoylglutathione lyase
MTRPIVHFEIMGRDAKRLQEFYRQLFGWEINADNPMNYGLVPPGVGAPENGIGGAVGQADRPYVAVYVQVVDLNETLAKAESLGGKAVRQPMDVPGGPTVAQLADPEGNIIGLVKQ